MSGDNMNPENSPTPVIPGGCYVWERPVRPENVPLGCVYVEGKWMPPAEAEGYTPSRSSGRYISPIDEIPHD